MTSHDVVAYLRKLLGTKSIGHTGTLDPGVPGVLPVCVGTATRVAEFLTEAGKAYRAEVTFGISTDTQDGFGRVVEKKPVYATYAEAISLIPAFTGWIKQIPPMVSAVKYGGKKLYELAREGKDVERQYRDVFIERIDPLWHDWDSEYPRITFDTTCSKGTYIRTLCADWGERLGCGGHMSYLLRTRSGPFSLPDAWTLEDITRGVSLGDTGFLIPPDQGVAHFPNLRVQESRIKALLNGLSLGPRDYSVEQGYLDGSEQWVRLYGPEGDFLALGLWETTGHIRPKKVFSRR